MSFLRSTTAFVLLAISISLWFLADCLIKVAQMFSDWAAVVLGPRR